MKLTEENYIERDVSWMLFNRRILAEAERTEIPLMERLHFLGIYSNNLDEFYRVRVATLSRISDYVGKNSKELRQRSKQTLHTIAELNAKYSQVFKKTVSDVFEGLRQKHIHLLSEKELNASQKEAVKKYCLSNLVGNISPIWLSSIKGVTSLSDDSIHFVIRLMKGDGQKKGSHKSYAIVEILVKKFGRFVQLPDEKFRSVVHHYVMYLDDVIRCALPYLFPGSDFDQVEAWSFKVTKDAEMELDSNIQGVTLQKIARGVKNRKNGQPVRFIYDEQMPRELLKKLLVQLKLSSVDATLPSGRHQNHKDLMKFPRFDSPNGETFEYPRWPSMRPEWTMQPVLIDVIRERDRFLHVPYQSFDGYINLLREAAIHPEKPKRKSSDSDDFGPPPGMQGGPMGGGVSKKRSSSTQKLVGKGVWINMNGKAAFRPVKTGLNDGVNVQILAGLAEGDSVVVRQESAAAVFQSSDGTVSPFMPGPRKKKK